jgi:hypothetical protein
MKKGGTGPPFDAGVETVSRYSDADNTIDKELNLSFKHFLRLNS